MYWMKYTPALTPTKIGEGDQTDKYYPGDVKLVFPGGSDGRESACNAGALGSIPGFGTSPEEGMAIQYSILAWRIPMDRGWRTPVHGGRKESEATELLILSTV